MGPNEAYTMCRHTQWAQMRQMRHTQVRVLLARFPLIIVCSPSKFKFLLPSARLKLEQFLPLLAKKSLI